MAEGHLASFKKDCCVLCKLSFDNENPVLLTKKGILILIGYSEKRGRDDILTYLNQCVSTDPAGLSDFHTLNVLETLVIKKARTLN